MDRTSALRRYGIVLCATGTIAAIFTGPETTLDVRVLALGEAFRLVGMLALTAALVMGEREGMGSGRQRSLVVLLITAVTVAGVSPLTPEGDPGNVALRTLLVGLAVLGATGAGLALISVPGEVRSGRSSDHAHSR